MKLLKESQPSMRKAPKLCFYSLSVMPCWCCYYTQDEQLTTQASFKYIIKPKWCSKSKINRGMRTLAQKLIFITLLLWKPIPTYLMTWCHKDTTQSIIVALYFLLCYYARLNFLLFRCIGNYHHLENAWNSLPY